MEKVVKEVRTCSLATHRKRYFPKAAEFHTLAPGDAALSCPADGLIIQGALVGTACLKNWELPNHFHRDFINGAGEAAGVGVNAGELEE